MKRSKISVVLVLIFCLIFLQVVQASTLNLRINSSLSSVESNSYFVTKTNNYSDGFDGFDSIILSPPSNYSLFYSTVSANNLMIDAWNSSTYFRVINLTYTVDSGQTGNLNFSWSHSDPEYGIILNDYGYNSNRPTPINSLSLYSPSFYTISGFNGSNRYLSLLITHYGAVNITPTRNNINMSNSINLSVTATSANNISSVWANVTFPNLTSTIYTLTGTYPNYNFNSATLDLPGEYLVTYYANDSLGNNGSTDDWFEVYDNYNWTANFVDHNGVPISGLNLSFYRPNTSTLLATNVTNVNGVVSLSLNLRFYDVKGTFSNGDSILIRSVNFSNQNIYLNFEWVNISSLASPPSIAMFNTPTRGIASNVSNFFTNFSMLLNFNYNPPSDPTAWKVLECSNWNYSTSSCLGTWAVLNSSVGGGGVSANATGLTAFVLAQTTCGNGGCNPGETYDGCRLIYPTSDDCAATGGTTIIGGGGGGGGGGGTVDLTKLEEIVKSFLNIAGIKVETASIYKEIYPGEETTVRIQLKNTLDSPTIISWSVEGAAKSFVSFEGSQVSLAPAEEKSILMTISVPKLTDPKDYESDLVLLSGKEQGKIPITIRVLSPEGKLIDIKVQPLLPSVVPGNILKVQTDIANTGKAASVNGTLELQILDIETGDVVLRHQEDFNVETSSSIISEMEIPQDFKTGKYMLKAVASYLDLDKNEVQVSSIAYVDINYPFFMRTILFLPVWAWLVILVLAGGISALAYFLWKVSEERKRYRVTLNLASLPQPGKNSEFIGKIAETGIRAFVDLNKLPTHTLIAGATGSGKTVAAQDLVESALLHNKSVVVFDPTAQWTGFLKKCEDSAMFKRYKYFDMNPNSATGFKGTLKTVTDPYEVIDLPKYTSQPGTITVFDVSHLTPKEIDLFVASSIEQVFKSNPQEARELKSLLVYDEVHRLLPKFGGSGEGFLQLERGAREFRKWGIGLVLISQVLSDFVGEVKANIGTEIQMGTRYEGDLERINMKYGEVALKSVVKEAVGTGMLVNAEYNGGKPYFVSFRPLLHNTQRLSDSDLAKYTEYFEKIENIEDQIAQLDKYKVDVLDLQLETKLARNKISLGQFQLAEMYVEPLTKKLEETWKKIGKKPAEKVKQKIARNEIEMGVKKAKEERQKFIKKEEVVKKDEKK